MRGRFRDRYLIRRFARPKRVKDALWAGVAIFLAAVFALAIRLIYELVRLMFYLRGFGGQRRVPISKSR